MYSRKNIKEEYKYEPDSSPEAWEYYKEYAHGILVGEPFSRNGSCRLKSKAKFKGIEFEVAGDCSFNVKLCVNYFSKMIEKVSDDNVKSKLYAELKELNKMHHNISNFALMPVAGGLNNLKGNLKIKNGKVMVHDLGKRPASALDRLDTFLYFLNESFIRLDTFQNQSSGINLKEVGEFFSESVFTTSMKGENFSILYDVLTSFNDIYDYCDIFYGLRRSDENHKKLVDKLIKNGNQPITSFTDVEKYMELANEFWSTRKFT